MNFWDDLLMGFGRISRAALEFLLLASACTAVFGLLTIIVGIGYESWGWWGIELLLLVSAPIILFFVPMPQYRRRQIIMIAVPTMIVLGLGLSNDTKQFAATLSLFISFMGLVVVAGYILLTVLGYGLAVAPGSPEETVKTAETRVKTTLAALLQILAFQWAIAFYVSALGPGISPSLGMFTLISVILAIIMGLVLDTGGTVAKFLALVIAVIAFSLATVFNVLKTLASYRFIDPQTNQEWIERVTGALAGMAHVDASLQIWYWVIALSILTGVIIGVYRRDYKDLKWIATVVLPLFAIFVINWWIWTADDAKRVSVWQHMVNAADYFANDYLYGYAWLVGVVIALAAAYVLRSTPATSTAARFLQRSALGTAFVFFVIWLIAAGGRGWIKDQITDTSEESAVTTDAPQNGDLPYIQFTAIPMVIEQGQSFTLRWQVTNADTCSASGDPEWSGTKPLSGSETIVPAYAVKHSMAVIYELTCNKSGHWARRKAEVTIGIPGQPVPIVPQSGSLSRWLKENRGILGATLREELVLGALAVFAVLGALGIIMGMFGVRTVGLISFGTWMAVFMFVAAFLHWIVV